jgi:hypothetical protein
MKTMQLLSVVFVLGLVGSVQAKALVSLPDVHNLKAPNFLPGGELRKNGQPQAIPVPEPSDWAWVPVLGTAGFLVWRRLRQQPAV